MSKSKHPNQAKFTKQDEARKLLFQGTTRATVAKRTGLAATTIDKLVSGMQRDGILDVLGNPPPIISVSHAAKVSCVSARRLRVLINEGRIEAQRIGLRSYGVNSESLKAFLNTERASGGAGQKLLQQARGEA